MYPLLASSYAAISDLHAAGLIYTVIQQLHTADIDHTNGFAAQDEVYCFGTATRHVLDIHQINAKKDPSKLQQHVRVSALQCLAISSAAVLFLKKTGSFTGSVKLA